MAANSLINENIVPQDSLIAEVLESKVLGTSNHQIRLFTYLVNAKYEGTLDRVKAYTIAVDAFGRPKDFDGSLDSIVRVEMFRLRANLRAFNEISENYRLELPKASYDIRITRKKAEIVQTSTPSPVSPQKLFDWRHLALATTSIIFAGLFLLQKLPLSANSDHCSDILPNVAIVNKSNSSDLELYVDQIIRGASSQYSHLNLVDDIKACRGSDTPGYTVEYTVFQDETAFRSTLSARSSVNREVIATRNVSGNLKREALNNNDLSDALYHNLVTVVNDWLKPNGVVHRNSMRLPWEDTQKYEDYSCIAIMYDSFISDSAKDYKNALTCLEKAYESQTPIIDNLGGLAASYNAQARGVAPKTVNIPSEKSQAIIEKIGSRWDQSVETAVAKIYFEAERKDYNSQRMRDTLLMAESKFNSNPIVLNEIAKHAGFRVGDWEYAKLISDKVKLIQSERDNSVYFVDAAYALQFMDASEALDTCVKTYSENSILSNLLINACAIRANNEIWEKRTDRNLNHLGLNSSAAKINFVNERSYDDDFKIYLKAIWNTPV